MKKSFVKTGAVTMLLLAVLLSGCGMFGPKPTVDPHAGQVYLYDGYDWVWYTPLQGVQTNAFKKEDFQFYGDTPYYVGSDFIVKRGFDVSEHQKEIDWSKISSASYDYVYIRAGRRGYTQGGLFEDPYFDVNYSGAKKSGLDVGVYFFSQAVTVSEAIEEANWVIDRIRGYSISLPIVFDWEKVDEPDSRTLNIDVTTLTDCAVAFCETIKRAGYEPCVYYNRTTGYYRFDLSRLTDYKVWFALPCTPPDIIHPSFYYHLDMWQYNLTGQVPGINYETDLDYMFIPIPKPVETSAPA